VEQKTGVEGLKDKKKRFKEQNHENTSIVLKALSFPVECKNMGEVYITVGHLVSLCPIW
jgi:hypothetical protein